MRRLLLFFAVFTLFVAPAGAQESSPQQISYNEYSEWVEQRDPLWKEELFRLEVGGYPQTESLRDTQQAILLKVRAINKIGPGPEAARLMGELTRLVQTLEQGLEEAFAPVDSGRTPAFSSI